MKPTFKGKRNVTTHADNDNSVYDAANGKTSGGISGGAGKDQSTLSTKTAHRDDLHSKYKSKFGVSPTRTEPNDESFTGTKGKNLYQSPKQIEKTLGLPHKGKKKK
jgi:hypothetical protein